MKWNEYPEEAYDFFLIFFFHLEAIFNFTIQNVHESIEHI